MVDMISMDLYELLGILSSATSQDIKKAYRKKALSCHPDKNPDNPKAVELFHELSRALEILTDDSARAAYDKVLNAKKAAILRSRELDSKRKKLKEDLEARERQAQFESFQEKSAEDKLKAEIERLRKEGSKQLEEEVEFVRLQVEREKLNTENYEKDPSLFRLRVKWDNAANSTYDYDSLYKIFSKFGEIAALVVSNKKKGSALLEFTSLSAAIKAQQLEKGFIANPLTVSWLSGTPPTSLSSRETAPSRNQNTTRPQAAPGASIFPSVPTESTLPTERRSFPCFPSAPDTFAKNRQNKQEEDFEKMVLLRMRQAEEDKRRATDNDLKKEES